MIIDKNGKNFKSHEFFKHSDYYYRQELKCFKCNYIIKTFMWNLNLYEDDVTHSVPHDIQFFCDEYTIKNIIE